MGSECVKAFINKVRAVNTQWVDALVKDLQDRAEQIRDTKPNQLSLKDLQSVVAKKISDYETLRLSIAAVAPNAPSKPGAYPN